MPRLAALLVLLLPLSAASADEKDPAALVGAISRLTGAGADAEQKAREALLALDPDPLETARLLREIADDYVLPLPEAGWRIREARSPEGDVRPYHLYVPSSYDGERPSAVLFHLHGGVSRPEYLTEDRMAEYRDWWKAEAEAGATLAVFPLGRQGAEWWTESQAGTLETIIRDLSREFVVDRDRVFVTGFSDGASGAYYLGVTHPTYFAGFIPMNGHPAVAAGASGRQLYLGNHAVRPLYIVATQEDSLYPAAAVLPFVATMMQAGAQVRLTSYPGIGHFPGYREEENPRIAAFLAATKRDPLPDRLSWETADLDAGRCAWVSILDLGTSPNAPDFPDWNVPTPDMGVKLGVRLDAAFEGPGARVESVVPESAAAALGIAAGDVIRAIDGDAVDDLESLRASLGAKRHGQPIAVAVERAETPMRLEGALPPFVPKPYYDRTRPSGRIDVVREGNVVTVKARGVARYALDLSPDEFDFAKEIVVRTNGSESFRGLVKPDAARVVDGFLADRDPRMLFAARLVIDLSK